MRMGWLWVDRASPVDGAAETATIPADVLRCKGQEMGRALPAGCAAELLWLT